MGLVAVDLLSTYQAQLHLPLVFNWCSCVAFIVCGLSDCSEFPHYTQGCTQGYSFDGYWFDRDDLLLMIAVLGIVT